MCFLFWNIKTVKVDLMVNVKMALLGAKFVLKKKLRTNTSLKDISIALNRHFSVTPYITICPSTETYFGLYLRGAMSAVTGTYLFRLLLNI